MLPTLVARPPRARLARGPEAVNDPSEAVTDALSPDAPDESRWAEIDLLREAAAGPSVALMVAVVGEAVMVVVEEAVTASLPARDKEDPLALSPAFEFPPLDSRLNP